MILKDAIQRKTPAALETPDLGIRREAVFLPQLGHLVLELNRIQAPYLRGGKPDAAEIIEPEMLTAVVEAERARIVVVAQQQRALVVRENQAARAHNLFKIVHGADHQFTLLPLLRQDLHLGHRGRTP